MRLFRFDTRTGACRGLINLPNGNLQRPTLREGEWYHVVSDGNPDRDLVTPGEWYKDVTVQWIRNIFSGRLLRKEPMPVVCSRTEVVADGVDTAVIEVPSVEPNGTGIRVTVTVDGRRHVIGDGVLEFSTLEPGVHRLELEGTNYLNTVLEVTAREAAAS